MKRIVIILTLFLFCSNCPAITIDTELDANNIHNSKFNIEIGQRDELIAFEVKYAGFWEIKTDSTGKVDSTFSVPYNLQTIVEIRDNETLISRFPVWLRFLGKNPGYYFEVSKDFLEFSKFTLIIHSTNGMYYAEIYWFNLKKMYDGLKAIEETKGDGDGK